MRDQANRRDLLAKGMKMAVASATVKLTLPTQKAFSNTQSVNEIPDDIQTQKDVKWTRLIWEP